LRGEILFREEGRDRFIHGGSQFCRGGTGTACSWWWENASEAEGGAILGDKGYKKTSGKKNSEKGHMSLQPGGHREQKGVRRRREKKGTASGRGTAIGFEEAKGVCRKNANKRQRKRRAVHGTKNAKKNRRKVHWGQKKKCLKNTALRETADRRCGARKGAESEVHANTRRTLRSWKE